MIGDAHDIARARIVMDSLARGEKNPFMETTSPGEDQTDMYFPLNRLRHKALSHACCWLWKAALIIPFLHIVLHLLGLPHPEVLSFIP